MAGRRQPIRIRIGLHALHNAIRCVWGSAMKRITTIDGNAWDCGEKNTKL
jgi:hypothetical protein